MSASAARMKKACRELQAVFMEAFIQASDGELGAILVLDPGGGLATAGPGVTGFGIAELGGHGGGGAACREDVVGSQAVILNQTANLGDHITDFLLACCLDLGLECLALCQKFFVCGVHGSLPFMD